MYCPSCAANNIDEARFCRACGATLNSRLQSRAGASPTLNEAEVLAHDLAESRKRKSVERGWMFLFIGVSFILMAFILRSVPDGSSWWFWMFPAAAAMLGMGIAQLATGKSDRKTLPSSKLNAVMPDGSPVKEIPTRDTSEISLPPSVTEGTTKLLEPESPGRTRDTIRQKPDKEL